MKTVDLTGKPFHFIGIGGIGMSALAYILAKRQFPVSGSDVRPSHITERLQSLGAQIFERQEATNLEGFCDKSQGKNGSSYQYHPEYFPQIICSTAISTSNAEYQAAIDKGYPIFHRSDLLAALIKDYYSVAVAGTHGKTTTSCLIGYMLLKAGLDPTIIVGGEVGAWEGNARLGGGKVLVAEADESDGSLTKHCPKIGIVTNIELDHTDHYKSLEDVVKTFQVFQSQSDNLIGCIDCENVASNLNPNISYSLDLGKNADYTVSDIEYYPDGSVAQVWERGKLLGKMKLLIPGKHNISNALAAVATGRLLGLEFRVIAEAIATFEGAKRRFEHRGSGNNITFIDDYAHHPSEILVTLSAARQRAGKYNAQRIVAIFQPHRYTRTQTFLKEFATCFQDADLVILTDIYSAGEKNVEGINGETVAEVVRQNHPQVIYHSDLGSLADFLQTILKPGDLALFLGAGNLNGIIPHLISRYPESVKSS